MLQRPPQACTRALEELVGLGQHGRDCGSVAIPLEREFVGVDGLKFWELRGVVG